MLSDENPLVYLEAVRVLVISESTDALPNIFSVLVSQYQYRSFSSMGKNFLEPIIEELKAGEQETS